MKSIVETDLSSSFENFNFGDTRINKRATKMIKRMSDSLGKSLPETFTTDADLEGAYRFFDNDLVTPKKILAPHAVETLERIKKQDTVLVVQDSSDISYDYLEDLEGLNPLHINVDKGIRLHPSLVITKEGTSLGVIHSTHYTRSTKTQKKNRNLLPIQEKESFRWYEGYLKACEIAKEAPNTTVVSIADREGDIYECLAEAEQAELGEKAHIILRAQHNRCLDNETNEITNLLEKKLIRMDVSYESQLEINKGKPTARIANIRIRATSICIKAPNTCKKKSLPSVTINAVIVSEVECAKGCEPLEWILLTTLPINTVEEIQQIIFYYTKRWQIEIFFKVLKSGCKIDSICLRSVERIENYIALCLLVAWKTMLATYLPRENPDAPCTIIFTELEWQLAYSEAYKDRPIPVETPTLKEISRLVANLGGYRLKSKTFPGIQSMWRGIICLIHMVKGYKIAERRLKKVKFYK